MRILHVTDVFRPQVGGIEVFVDDLVRRQAVDHDVRVLTPAMSRTPDDLSVLRLPLSRALRLDLREFDVVHGHLSVLSPYTTAVVRGAVLVGTPVVLSVHSLWSGRMPFVRSVGALAGWRRWPVAWTAVSNVAADDVRRALGRQGGVHVVPNAVDPAWWRPDPPAPVGGRPLTIVSVMRLAPRKRPLAFLGVLRDLRAVLPDELPLRAVLVGDGPLAGQVAETAGRLGLGEWLELTGPLHRAEIRERYTSADLYVAPAHRESFGIAALEARAAGIPVFAMRSGGVGEFVRDGVEGLLCDDDDHLVRALAHLASSPGALAAMARHNREVPPVHDWTRVIEGFEAVYGAAADLAARHRRASVLRFRTGAA